MVCGLLYSFAMSEILDTPTFHITMRCNNREPFPGPLGQVWDVFSEQLHFIHHAYNVRIIHFVLMSNHFHLIACFPENNRSSAMNHFLRESSRIISYNSGRSNHLFGRRHHWTLIRTDIQLLNTYKYVLRNPVHAGITHEPQMYSFSTFGRMLGLHGHLLTPILEDTTYFNSPEHCMNWLLKKPKAEHLEDLKLALKRKIFKLKRKPGYGPHELNTNLI